MTADDYLQQLIRLLPRGRLWESLCEPGKKFRALLQAQADELARVHARDEQLLVEADPFRTSELLLDWEHDLDLPAPCVADLEQTEDDRRGAVVSKLRGIHRLSKQFYIDQAAALGETITIVTDHGFRMGIDGMGDALGGPEWGFIWHVHVWGSAGPNELLECVFNDLNHAYAHVEFHYHEED